jgi:hypothetical protein
VLSTERSARRRPGPPWTASTIGRRRRAPELSCLTRTVGGLGGRDPRFPPDQRPFQRLDKAVNLRIKSAWDSWLGSANLVGHPRRTRGRSHHRKEAAVLAFVGRFAEPGRLRVCYEAGPTGYPTRSPTGHGRPGVEGQRDLHMAHRQTTHEPRDHRRFQRVGALHALAQQAEVNGWSMPRSLRRSSATGPAVVLTWSSAWPLQDPARSRSPRSVALTAQELAHLGLQRGL